MDRLVFKARLRLLAQGQGGRKQPIRSDYRPSWDLGNTWLGKPTINDGRVILVGDEHLGPGDEGDVRIEPLAPEFWGRVRVGSVIPMQEGSRVVGHATILEIASRPDSFSPEIAAFVDQARQFCDFIEKASEYPLNERLTQARVRLLELYRAGLELPHVEPPAGVEAGASPEPPKSWAGFGKVETYWEVFDPYEEDKPVCGSLSDDLLDIYRDVHRGLRLWDGNVPRTAALWEWRFHLDQHWGGHAVDALRALHRACGRA